MITKLIFGANYFESTLNFPENIYRSIELRRGERRNDRTRNKSRLPHGPNR